MSPTLNLVSQEIQKIVEKKREITFTELEDSVNASFNLIFLAIDSMVADHKIQLRRTERDYVIFCANIEKASLTNSCCMN